MKEPNKFYNKIIVNLHSTPFFSILVYVIFRILHWNSPLSDVILYYFFMLSVVKDSLHGKLKISFLFAYICLFLISAQYLYKYYFYYILLFPIIYKFYEHVSSDIKIIRENRNDGDYEILTISIWAYLIFFFSSMFLLLVYIVYIYLVHHESLFNTTEVEFVILPHLFGIIGYFSGSFIDRLRKRKIRQTTTSGRENQVT